MRQNSLRVLEDYELDYVSGGLDGEADFEASPFVIPDGYTLENISGAFLEQNLVTGEWTIELVFESNFTEAGYSGDDGGGFYVDEPIYQGDSGFDTGMLSAGGQRTTTTTTVTTTKTSPSATFSVNFFGLARFSFAIGGTVTTTQTTTSSSGRLTSEGKTGRIASK